MKSNKTSKKKRKKNKIKKNKPLSSPSSTPASIPVNEFSTVYIHLPNFLSFPFPDRE
jgi:hypothetical protein